MCIGIPCQIISIDPASTRMALADINGVRRLVDISLIDTHGKATTTLIGQWVLVHVGFAMNLLDEQDAKDTLEALKAMGEMEPDVDLFLGSGAGSGYVPL